ncbi:hypothetical protein AJ78_02583 [Emergomyces pasteurianus Ep9510]|uniref:Uncharacterized protein n=1 Tax=Emergomyces pasteurianus Ep9510 TaxID=1447872 RepID=A0A1J9QMB9_9EURO|nr:hypothetical protein AJ78_02583 [Emergomyces pasteurianus Ep9510]
MAVSLYQIQPIVSFPPSCTRVYTTEISGCVVSDFTNRGSCSAECIESLETLSRSLNVACVGTRAFSKSLIGLFFQGLGVQTLCPNAAGGDREIESPVRSNPPQTPPSTETRLPQPTQTQTEEPSTRAPPSARSSATSTTTTKEFTSTRSTFTITDSYFTTSSMPSTPASDPVTTRTTPKLSATPRINPEKDPFGGFGNVFDIIAPNRAATIDRSRKMAIGIAASAVLFTIQLAWQ